MRKVSVRRVWNKLNDGYGNSILPGMKHNVYSLLNSYITDVNLGDITTREDFLDGIVDHLCVYFNTPSLGAHLCGVITQWVFDLAEGK